MIRKCNQCDLEMIFNYIGTEYYRCLYLYLNLKRYGVSGSHVDSFIQLDNDIITAVVLKYYSCIHVYSAKNNFDFEEIIEFIKNYDNRMIYCVKETAERIYENLPIEVLKKISITNGWVAKINKIDLSTKSKIALATERDFKQIVQMIYDDEEIGKSYDYHELESQLAERNHEGYTRNYVIKQEDNIIAHACTNAETENIAVVAELLVKKEFRCKGYGQEIWAAICAKLLSEGKEVYSFYYSDDSRRLHKKIGFSEICHWTKIVFVK